MSGSIDIKIPEDQYKRLRKQWKKDIKNERTSDTFNTWIGNKIRNTPDKIDILNSSDFLRLSKDDFAISIKKL